MARIANSSTTRTAPRAAITAKLDHPVAEKVRQNHEERLADIEKALVASPPSQSRGTYLGRVILQGTGTYTPTIGTRLVSVRMVGGGGGGGGIGTGSGGASAGGGNSGWCIEFDVSANSQIAGGLFACGAGGAAGTTAGSNGGTGGDTTITVNGILFTAKGGTGGGGATLSAVTVVRGPATPATQVRSFGTVAVSVATFGPGGIGFSISGAPVAGGMGGESVLGAGAIPLFGNANGASAGGPGGGGGGGNVLGGTAVGGAGAAGAIVIEEYA